MKFQDPVNFATLWPYSVQIICQEVAVVASSPDLSRHLQKVVFQKGMGVDTTVGVLLVGVFFNTFLYGLVTYQFAAYYHAKFNDRPATKYMVLFLFILDTFHSAAVIYMAWYYAVLNYNNPSALGLSVWPYQFTPFGTALAAFVTQMFLGVRIWRLTRSKVLYGVVVLLSIPCLVLGIVCSIEAWLIKFLSEMPRLTRLVIPWLTTQVLADTTITATLIIAFCRLKTGYPKTDTVINRFIRCAIQTGVFAVIFALGDLLTFVIIPDTNIYGMFCIPIGRIYTNTLMDTLLTREMIKTEVVGVRRKTECAEFTTELSMISETEHGS